MKIFKYEFRVEDEVWIDMPIGAKILSIGTQNEREICVWALVDPEAELESCGFLVRGTGHPCNLLPETFIGTVFDGPYVWHVFEA